MIQDDGNDRTRVCVHLSPSGPINPATWTDWEICSPYYLTRTQRAAGY